MSTPVVTGSTPSSSDGIACEHADSLGGELVHRYATGIQVGAGGATDRRPGQPGGILDVVAVAGERALVAQVGENQDVVLVPCQGLEDR